MQSDPSLAYCSLRSILCSSLTLLCILFPEVVGVRVTSGDCIFQVIMITGFWFSLISGRPSQRLEDGKN